MLFLPSGRFGYLCLFPSPCRPVTCEKLSDLLHKARAEGRSNLIVMHASSKCLSFCPFCLYTGSNDQMYMSHIICGHYDVVYGCRKCLDKVTVSGLQMFNHFKHYKGLKEKSAGPEKVGDDVKSPSGDVMAGRSRDKPKKKKKKKMKSHKKSPEVPPPTGSVASPHHSACITTEKPPARAEETSPKMRSPARSGKHLSKQRKDGGEKLTKKSEKDMPKEDMLMKGTPQKGKTCSKDKTDLDKPCKKKKT